MGHGSSKRRRGKTADQEELEQEVEERQEIEVED